MKIEMTSPAGRVPVELSKVESYKARGWTVIDSKAYEYIINPAKPEKKKTIKAKKPKAVIEKKDK